MKTLFILRSALPNDLEAIAELVLGIQRGEFGFDIRQQDQPDLVDPGAVFGSGQGCFFVIEFFGRIVACAGLQDCGEGIGQVRKMFVAAPFRGGHFGLAQRLMQRLIVHGREHGFVSLYLGTVSKLERAISFYRKWGFRELPVASLPTQIQVAPVDDRAFKLELSEACVPANDLRRSPV